jgi:hypothetical protein
LTPVPGNQPGLGIYDKDLKRLGAKEGNWVGVKYNGKTTSAMVRIVHQTAGWPDHLAWVYKTQQEELGLSTISGNDPTHPPQNVELVVWKHMFTRSKQLLPAVGVFALLTVTAILTAFVQGGIFPEYKIAFGITALILTIVSIGINVYFNIFSQKQ